jgi:hypothetical protein
MKSKHDIKLTYFDSVVADDWFWQDYRVHLYQIISFCR